MKVINVLFLLIFLLCVGVQYNDPDPFRWMVIYGFAAICCILFATRKLPVFLPVAVAVAALVWVVSLLPSVWGKTIPIGEVFSMIHMFSPGVEEVREIGGLLIVVSWMIVLFFKNRSFIRA